MIKFNFNFDNFEKKSLPRNTIEKIEKIKEAKEIEKLDNPDLIQLNEHEVWIIDDNKDIIESVLRFLKEKLKEVEYEFNHFDTAKSALNELKRRIQNYEILPGIILVDGYLDLDDEDLNSGPIVVEKIKNLVKKIKIIGFSGLDLKNEEMIRMGAEKAFRKTEISLLADYLRQLNEEQKSKEKNNN